MKLLLVSIFFLTSFVCKSQTEGGFADDPFAAESFSSGMVYMEMNVFVKDNNSKISFDFGTEETSSELRKDALWDKEAQKEVEFKSTVDAIKHLEGKQWMIKSSSVALDNGEIYKYYLMEKMKGF